MPAHLLRIPIPHRVADAQRICPKCEVEARPIGPGHDVEKLEVIPAQHVVHQHIFELLGGHLVERLAGEYHAARLRLAA